MLKSRHLVATALFTLVLNPSAFSSSCDEILNARNDLSLLSDMTVEHYTNGPADTLNAQLNLATQYQTLLRSGAERFVQFDRLINTKQVYAIQNDHSARLYQLRLTALIEKFNNGKFVTERGAINTLKRFLHNRVPESSIEGRISGLIESNGTSLKAVQLALGEMEMNELQILTHGGDPLHPTPESLLGQYIERTGAATLAYSFPTTARNSANAKYESFGAPKLVVSLSEKSVAVYNELFTRPEFLIHDHTPYQGTLYLAFNGKSGSYMNFSSTFNPVQSVDTLLPHILLPSQEAQRMLLISELGAAENTFRESWQIPDFCKMGGYNSCTHWVGNLPIGRTLVLNAKHPGKIDSYANNAVGKRPQISEFQPYDVSAFADDWVRNTYLRRGWGFSPEQIQSKIEALEKWLPLVWKNDGQGVNMGLSEMLGKDELKANFAGEYANPGYVAHRLTGNVSNEWVPFVFRVVADHTKKFSSRIDLKISAY